MAPPKHFNRKDLEAALAQAIANAGNSNRAPKRVQVSDRQYWFLNKAGYADDVIDSKAEGGLKSFNNWFTDVKAEYAAFQAAHNRDGPAPSWAYDVYRAAGLSTDELDGLTDVQAYNLLKKLLPGGCKAYQASKLLKYRLTLEDIEDLSEEQAAATLATLDAQAASDAASPCTPSPAAAAGPSTAHKDKRARRT